MFLDFHRACPMPATLYHDSYHLAAGARGALAADKHALNQPPKTNPGQCGLCNANRRFSGFGDILADCSTEYVLRLLQSLRRKRIDTAGHHLAKRLPILPPVQNTQSIRACEGWAVGAPGDLVGAQRPPGNAVGQVSTSYICEDGSIPSDTKLAAVKCDDVNGTCLVHADS